MNTYFLAHEVSGAELFQEAYTANFPPVCLDA